MHNSNITSVIYLNESINLSALGWVGKLILYNQHFMSMIIVCMMLVGKNDFYHLAELFKRANSSSVQLPQNCCPHLNCRWATVMLLDGQKWFIFTDNVNDLSVGFKSVKSHLTH